jgi:hypothetical protein
MIGIRVGAPVASLGVVLALGACAVPPPSGPAVMALPPQGKSFAQFQQEDVTCRGYASQQSGGAPAAAAATQNAAAGPVVGTLVGAAAGAVIGAAAGNPGAGAAIGAGTGLIVGTGAGSANAGASAAGLQQAYDTAYTQCMYSNGNKVVAQQPVAVAGAYPYGYGGYGPYVAGPVIGLGFGGFYGGGYYGGGGWRGDRREGWRGDDHWRR